MTGINYSASGVAVGQHDMVGTDYYQWDPRGKLDPGTIRSIPGNTGLLSVGTGHALENHPVVYKGSLIQGTLRVIVPQYHHP